MDFTPSPKAQELRSRVVAFLERHVYPVEAELLGLRGRGEIHSFGLR